MPPLSFFAGKVQFKGSLNNALSYDRLKNLEPDVDMSLLADWQIVPFTTTPFTQWWSECQEHIFCKSVNLYLLFASFNHYFLQDDGRDPPTISRSGQPINYALPADKPNIGHNSPSLTDVATGRKRKLSITKVASRKKNKSPGPSSAAAIPQTNDLANLPSSSSEGNFLDSLYACNHIDTNHTIHSDYQHIPKDLGMISEFIHKSILHITNNYLSACRSCID